MSYLNKKLLSISCLCLLLFPSSLPAQAQPGQQGIPASLGSKVYQRAKEELPEDLYGLYRIIDRIARANQYDNRSWLMGVVQQYNVNAFGDESNLIPIYHGLFEQLTSDSSALACVIAHEMGHHIKNHNAINETKKAELIAQLKAEADKEVLGEQKTAATQAVVFAVGDLMANRVQPGIAGDMVGSAIEKQNRDRLAASQKRINEIVAKKTQELEQHLAEEVEAQEIAADEIAYVASVKAGFEAEGCLRVLQLLAQTPGFEYDTNHPSIPKRIEALNAMMSKYPPQSLAEDGESQISATAPLNYEISQDRTRLEIKSRHGASLANDIENRFGK